MNTNDTTNPNRPSFDLEKVHDQEIAPLMAQILAICEREGIPMIASVCYASGENGSSTATSANDRGGWQLTEYARALACIRHQALPLEPWPDTAPEEPPGDGHGKKKDGQTGDGETKLL